MAIILRQKRQETTLVHPELPEEWDVAAPALPPKPLFTEASGRRGVLGVPQLLECRVRPDTAAGALLKLI